MAGPKMGLSWPVDVSILSLTNAQGHNVFCFSVFFLKHLHLCGNLSSAAVLVASSPFFLVALSNIQ